MLKLEWTKQRAFECEVLDAWGLTRKRIICRHRDDGIFFSMIVDVGHPCYDTREYIVQRFAKFACEKVTDVAPGSEEEFDQTFLLNLHERHGEEIVSGSFYSFLQPDLERVREWEEKRWSRMAVQRIQPDSEAERNPKQ